MSDVRTLSIPNLRPMTAEPTTPAAGPENSVNTGRSPMAAIGSTPPAFVIIMSGTRIPAARNVSSRAAR